LIGQSVWFKSLSYENMKRGNEHKSIKRYPKISSIWFKKKGSFRSEETFQYNQRSRASKKLLSTPTM